MKEFNSIIKSLRKTHGVSQKELGEMIGISSTAMGKIERGETRLNSEHIRKISAALGESEEKVFLGYTPRRESETELREINFYEDKLRKLREEKDAEIARLQEKLETADDKIADLKEKCKLQKQINAMQEKQIESLQKKQGK